MSAYTSSADAKRVLEQVGARLYPFLHPGSYAPSSVPVTVTVPGVPGALAQFTNFSTLGQYDVYFAQGNVVAWVDVTCSPVGDDSCEVAITTAHAQYTRLRG